MVYSRQANQESSQLAERRLKRIPNQAAATWILQELKFTQAYKYQRGCSLGNRQSSLDSENQTQEFSETQK